MIISRDNEHGDIARTHDVFLDGIQQQYAFEALTPGDSLKGQGWIIRGVPDAQGHLQVQGDGEPGHFMRQGVLCEKAKGYVEFRLPEVKAQAV